MRHNKNDKRFSRHSGHLRAMLANMTSDLIANGRIKTTTAKAKELRRYAERMITLGKDGSLSARRRVMAFLRSKEAVKKLFGDLAPGFSSRNGGYTRIIKSGLRPGDCAPMSVIEFVEKKVSPTEGGTPKVDKKTAKKAAPNRKPSVKTKEPAAKKEAAKKAKPSTEKKTATAKKKTATVKKSSKKSDK